MNSSEKSTKEPNLPGAVYPTSLLDNEVSPIADPEITEPKPKYPKSVFFIISNEFCERFSYYGMRTILAIYLKNILLYSDDDATVIYHVFTMLCYFFPIFGAMLADSLLGKFRTIFYISIVYAVGNVVISLASAEDEIGLPAREFSLVGLLLIAIGTGGIKPCVSAFGGDQFKLPQQERQLQQFFSLFYFAINSGSLISTFLTPILREDVTCLNQDTCYPLAFGVPAALMIVSIVIFILGKKLYIIKKPEGNIVLKVCSCISHALVRRPKLKHEKREHWLDYADDKYDKTLINDTKATLRVLFLYIPLPFFWALFDQQGSRWTFQATRMTGELGGWNLKPDQMQVVNPLLILAFIPLCEYIIYPLLAKCNLLIRPLQRLGVGGVLAALAFVISALVELQLQDTYAVVPKAGEAQLRIFNGYNCSAEVNIPSVTNGFLPISPHGVWASGNLAVTDTKQYDIEYKSSCFSSSEFSSKVHLKEKQGTSYFITYSKVTNNTVLESLEPYDTIEKSENGFPLLRVIYSYRDTLNNKTLNLKEINGAHSQTINLDGNKYVTEDIKMDPTSYSVEVDGQKLEDIKLRLGGVYSLLLQENKDDQFDMNLLTVTDPNSMHMLWLIPQYFVITMGEVMFSITGLEFSYSQAPVSMKSVLQAAWLLTVAFGNLIVVIIAEAKFFDSQANEFFLFAGLMLVDMGIFVLMAMKYKYVEIPDAGDDENLKTNGVPLKEKHVKNGTGTENNAYKNED